MAQTSSVFTNPMISKLSKVEIPAEERTATYAGITVKTLFFLALTGVGAVSYTHLDVYKRQHLHGLP